MRINKRIYMVASGRAGSNFTDPFDCDVYLVDCGDGLVLIDAGVGTGTPRILEQIRFYGFDPKEIRYLLITHGHADHAGGVASLCQATGATALAHPQCASYITQGNTEAIALAGAIRAGLYPPDYQFTPWPVGEIADGESLTVGDVTFIAYDAPGHSSGHNVYLMDSDCGRFLFAGDAFFLNGAVHLQNVWDCDIPAYAQTAKKLSALTFDGLLPSHHGIDLQEGMTHIRLALEAFDQLVVPPQI